MEPDSCLDLAAATPPLNELARRSSVGRLELDLVKPDAVVSRHLYNLVKKALLPRDGSS